MVCNTNVEVKVMYGNLMKHKCDAIIIPSEFYVGCKQSHNTNAKYIINANVPDDCRANNCKLFTAIFDALVEANRKGCTNVVMPIIKTRQIDCVDRFVDALIEAIYSFVSTAKIIGQSLSTITIIGKNKNWIEYLKEEFSEQFPNDEDQQSKNVYYQSENELDYYVLNAELDDVFYD